MFELQTQNMPIMSTLRGWKYGFNSPFKAEVYFISMRNKKSPAEQAALRRTIITLAVIFGLIILMVSIRFTAVTQDAPQSSQAVAVAGASAETTRLAIELERARAELEQARSRVAAPEREGSCCASGGSSGWLQGVLGVLVGVLITLVVQGRLTESRAAPTTVVSVAPSEPARTGKRTDSETSEENADGGPPLPRSAELRHRADGWKALINDAVGVLTKALDAAIAPGPAEERSVDAPAGVPAGFWLPQVGEAAHELAKRAEEIRAYVERVTAKPLLSQRRFGL